MYRGQIRAEQGCALYKKTDFTNAVTLSLSDEDFAKMVSGKTQAQRLFMSGKLKIKGDVMKVCLCGESAPSTYTNCYTRLPRWNQS